jgi:hypothetical protein
MRDVTYWQAWSLWLDGKPTTDLRMWGEPMLVWGRVGKVLQFLGALTVIVDIIGPDRLRRFGQDLRSETGVVRRILAVLLVLRSTLGQLVLGAGVLALILLVVVGPFLPDRPWIWDIFDDPTLLIIALAPFLVVLAPYVLTMVVLGVAELGVWSLDRLLLQPLARALSSRPVDLWAKIAGFALVITGTKFDLLAT